MNLLTKLGAKYDTDKSPLVMHFYTDYYYKLFKDMRRKVKKVVEMGIGSPETMGKHCKHYVTGASLYMWRDFFPNAQIYGADIDPKTMFKADRIKTFLCDSTKKKDVENLIKHTGSDIDIFIDDGTHYFYQILFLCKTVMPLLQDKVIYVIEDALYPTNVVHRLGEFDCYIPPSTSPRRIYRDSLIVVRKK